MKLALGELLCYAAIAVVLDTKYRRNARKRREWTKQWLLKRHDFSHVNLLKELRFHSKDCHNFLRMNESTYLTLLSMVSPLIQGKNTTMRQAITPHQGRIQAQADQAAAQGSRFEGAASKLSKLLIKQMFAFRFLSFINIRVNLRE